MKIAIVGGGPAGLYSAILLKKLDPQREIVIWERNAPDDTFGFGVVFSDETLGGIEHADPCIYEQMAARFARWEDIDVHYRGEMYTIGGQGFAAMSRKELLHILQQRCAELAVELHFSTIAPPVEELQKEYDLIIAADGLHSHTRDTYSAAFQPSLDPRHNYYIWLGTDLVFESFKFYTCETPYGPMQIHGYPFSATRSTFIVEVPEEVWYKAGFNHNAEKILSAGESDGASIDMIRALFADILQDYQLFANNSRWIKFSTVRNAHWHYKNIVLLGDAAHTAHFSIGSGTKLAMEDALALAACIQESPTIAAALTAYEQERTMVVESTQRAAQASLEWFESLPLYTHQAPEQFVFNLLTRSRRITYDNIKLRDREYAASLDEWYRTTQSLADHDELADQDVRPPMFYPKTIKSITFPNRVIVSPMDMYSAQAGVVGDFHLTHLGSKALGGAGLVMTEMVCVSAIGRITPYCSGIYTDEQADAWKRIVSFVHEYSPARIGIQLGHAGRKGSTKPIWEGMDDALDTGNWELIAPTALAYGPKSRTPRELEIAELPGIIQEFVDAAIRADRAGFDVLELHCAHGYLLSSFLSPLANQRTDRYGGTVENRLNFPLEVFDAIYEVWPQDKPIAVRLSASDWAEGGNTIDDAVVIARAFAEHGADIIDVSSGQVVKHEKPAYGRSYQTPFADRIRNELGPHYPVSIIAVGAISSYDDVNSILLSGRSDFIALGRTHLYDPQWTLHAAAEQNYRGAGAQWPPQYAAGKRKPATGRVDGPPPRLSLISQPVQSDSSHLRWTP